MEFKPNHLKIKKSNGQIARSDERAETLAEYFRTKQWDIDNSKEKKLGRPMIFNNTSPINEDFITVEELRITLKKLKNNKSPGPDGLPAEFYKWCKEDTVNGKLIAQEICNILNKCWQEERIPLDLEFAQVVTIFKKGNIQDPGNYRPISLLQSLYKIYAAIIQKRLAEYTEEKVWKNQFGFRAKHSTAEALHITRRIQDYYESSGSKFFSLTGAKPSMKLIKQCCWTLYADLTYLTK